MAEVYASDLSSAISLAVRGTSADHIGAFRKPVARAIPIWVGGWGEVAARRAAGLGGGYMTISSTPEMVAQQLATVGRELEKLGCNLDAMEVSMLGGIRLGSGMVTGRPALIGGSTGQIIERLGQYRDAGLQHLIGTPRSGDAGQLTPDRLIADMQFLAEEIIPAFE
ncbi:MAG: hypothetical protein ACR2PL_06950 [Dehalococcoidia bacterium]